MSSPLPRVSRMRSLPLFALLVLALGLTGCYTKLGTVASTSSSGPTAAQTSPVAEATPSSEAAVPSPSAHADTLAEVDRFFREFDHDALEYLSPSDRLLVERATRLLTARADGDISHAAYRDRIYRFKQEHPAFYGNFFGDPFYATYDLQYTRLAELRRRINIFVNPQNGIWNTAGFFCNPMSYDPNFGGVCQGFSFSPGDFFFSPFSPLHANRGGLFYASAVTPHWSYASYATPSWGVLATAPDGGTAHRGIRAAAPMAVEQPIRLPEHVDDAMQEELTAEFHRFLARRTAEMEWRERVDLSRHLASNDRMTGAERADLIAQIRDRQARSAYRDRHRRDHSEFGAHRSDRRESSIRDTRSRQTSQIDRGNSDSSDRSRTRSRSSERSDSEGNSGRNRSRGGGS